MIQYRISRSGSAIIIDDPVLTFLDRHRQLRFWQREAGGQLFARFIENDVRIELATGPRSTDKRSRTSFIPDRKSERAEIAEQFAKGLHYVGDWHSHPEPEPHFSSCDANSMRDCFRRSTHQLNGFLLLIVGQLPPPNGLELSIHASEIAHVLVPVIDNTTADAMPSR